MADERHDQTEEQRTVARRPPITDTMEDFWRLIIQEEYFAIRQPGVSTPSCIVPHIEDVVIRPYLVPLFLTFHGMENENPHTHMRFLGSLHDLQGG